jgi:hypothetical protein
MRRGCAVVASVDGFVSNTCMAIKSLNSSRRADLTNRIIGTFISRRLKSHEVVFDTLLTIAEQRCLERDMKNLGHSVPNHVSPDHHIPDF